MIVILHFYPIPIITVCILESERLLFEYHITIKERTKAIQHQFFVHSSLKVDSDEQIKSHINSVSFFILLHEYLTRYL